MPETTQQYTGQPIAISVGIPHLTWTVGGPELGGTGLITTGTYNVVSPIEVTV